MARRPPIQRTISGLNKATALLRRGGQNVALVPTMGALHEGHISLVHLAKKRAKRVVVSIFVNPAQFAPHEDFDTYPRSPERDLAALAELKVDLVWMPATEVMYPKDFATRIVPSGAASAGLEDAFRPHFFGGVATIVAKLFLQVRPDIAVFGEKDYQQLKVVTRMVRDLDLPVKVIGGPTVREKDGLALSSRNAYLSIAERKNAPVLYRTLRDCAAKIRSGSAIVDALAVGREKITRMGFILDYLEARHADTLAPISSRKEGPVRLLVAGRIGTTRLIDNIAV